MPPFEEPSQGLQGWIPIAISAAAFGGFCVALIVVSPLVRDWRLARASRVELRVQLDTMLGRVMSRLRSGTGTPAELDEAVEKLAAARARVHLLSESETTQIVQAIELLKIAEGRHANLAMAWTYCDKAREELARQGRSVYESLPVPEHLEHRDEGGA